MIWHQLALVLGGASVAFGVAAFIDNEPGWASGFVLLAAINLVVGFAP